MRILVIADPKIPVPPVDYGGAERIAHLLCRELQRLGHTVQLIAAPGSREYGGGLVTHKAPSLSYHSRVYRKLLFQGLSLFTARTADVVINFGRTDYLEALLKTPIPLVSRYGNPVSQAELDWIRSRRRAGLRFIGISHSQFSGLDTGGILDVVYNATDTDLLLPPPAPKSYSYLAFLGRLTANKGVDTAIAVARRTGLPLKIAGTIMDHEPGSRGFFEKEVRPALGSQIEYIGPVGDADKRKFLGEAAALLFPIRWQEPFGIVMAEALACGTPVIGTRRACVPEVVDHGRTGFIVDSEDEMVEAVGKLDTISRETCRNVAEARFSARQMALGYLESIARLGVRNH